MNPNKMLKDCGPTPHCLNVTRAAEENSCFRVAVWTGECVQMTLMCIPPCEEIGEEMHPHVEQIIRVEQGSAIVRMGKCRGRWNAEQLLCEGDAVFVPAGTWHNVINASKCALKLSSIYAPPNHPRGTVHVTKADGEKEE